MNNYSLQQHELVGREEHIGCVMRHQTKPKAINSVCVAGGGGGLLSVTILGSLSLNHRYFLVKMVN